jgi:hypothetical protein
MKKEHIGNGLMLIGVLIAAYSLFPISGLTSYNETNYVTSCSLCMAHNGGVSCTKAGGIVNYDNFCKVNVLGGDDELDTYSCRMDYKTEVVDLNKQSSPGFRCPISPTTTYSPTTSNPQITTTNPSTTWYVPTTCDSMGCYMVTTTTIPGPPINLFTNGLLIIGISCLIAGFIITKITK